MRDFIGIGLAMESVPDATTLRHLLEKHALTQRIFEEIHTSLAEQGLLMRQGIIADATIVAAAPSTKNQAQLFTLLAHGNLVFAGLCHAHADGGSVLNLAWWPDTPAARENRPPVVACKFNA